jgi:hypothetical protein
MFLARRVLVLAGARVTRRISFMRRIAFLGLAVLLSGCEFAASPFVGLGGFIGDTHTVSRNPNQPVANSTNVLRVIGRPVSLPPLEPEPGNVWPGPQAPEPTLQDIEQQQNSQTPPASLGPQGTAPQQPTPPRTPVPTFPSPASPQLPSQPTPQVRGSSSPPAPNASLPALQPVPGPSSPPAPLQPTTPSAGSRTFVTPQGPVQGTTGGNGITTFTAPGGGTGIVVPNGNGTSTLIGPDGTVATVPTPK